MICCIRGESSCSASAGAVSLSSLTTALTAAGIRSCIISPSGPVTVVIPAVSDSARAVVVWLFTNDGAVASAEEISATDASVLSLSVSFSVLASESTAVDAPSAVCTEIASSLSSSIPSREASAEVSSEISSEAAVVFSSASVIDSVVSVSLSVEAFVSAAEELSGSVLSADAALSITPTPPTSTVAESAPSSANEIS